MVQHMNDEYDYQGGEDSWNKCMECDCCKKACSLLQLQVVNIDRLYCIDCEDRWLSGNHES
jgi:hypothetical protein